MKQGLLLWSPCPHPPLSQPSFPFLSLSIPRTKHALSQISATLDSTTTTQEQDLLTARERRQLRNEKRESKSGYNWREELEERFIKKPKKKPTTSVAEELNLDKLALLGPQWWIVRVSRIRGDETADVLARLLARNFPQMDFKVYAPSVKERRKLKNGTYSVKPKPIFPGCIHDFARECDGVGGFVGAKVGNTKRQINKPRPVSDNDMEAVFQQAKEEQEKADTAFEEEQQAHEAPNSVKLGSNNITQSFIDSNSERGLRRNSGPLVSSSSRKKDKLPKTGSTVRVVSGTFADFVGSLKKLNRKTGKATVVVTLFGKESLVELDLNEIVAETK
ncbi:KOW domain-containing transcription factor family protein [Salix suchowensis]|nr:KOW domain-containing transcription factor family protein [Salix suchowensis]